MGINIQYKEQDAPRGLPDAFILGEQFINNQNVAMILGDNFFYGQSLSTMLNNCIKLDKGAKIILHKVLDPQKFGVAKIMKKKILSIKEKPKKFFSNLAITGLYFFDKNVVKYSKELKPSKRNELEIVDLINLYKNKKKLKITKLGRGSAWMDVGNFSDLQSASNFIQNIENRQNYKIGCIEEIAFNNKWVNKKNIIKRIKHFANTDYSSYLKNLISN